MSWIEMVSQWSSSCDGIAGQLAKPKNDRGVAVKVSRGEGLGANVCRVVCTADVHERHKQGADLITDKGEADRLPARSGSDAVIGDAVNAGHVVDVDFGGTD